MAAIQEKAPAAEYYAVRVFCSSLRTRVEYLLRSIEWSLDHGIHVINLSLGTMNAEHAARFVPLVERAAREGAVLVAAREAGGQPAYPGVLPGVIAAAVDWSCPREYYRALHCGKEAHFWASGYPRPLPGKPQELNLHGISFAVANMSGFVVRACEGMAVRTRESVIHGAPGRIRQCYGAGGALTYTLRIKSLGLVGTFPEEYDEAWSLYGNCLG